MNACYIYVVQFEDTDKIQPAVASPAFVIYGVLRFEFHPKKQNGLKKYTYEQA